MKLLVLYRPVSEHATLVEMFIRDFQHRNPDVAVELVDADTREGVAKAQAYGVLDFPVLVAVDSNDVPLYLWQGTTLPLMDEVASYLYS